MVPKVNLWGFTGRSPLCRRFLCCCFFGVSEASLDAQKYGCQNQFCLWNLLQGVSHVYWVGEELFGYKFDFGENAARYIRIRVTYTPIFLPLAMKADAILSICRSARATRNRLCLLVHPVRGSDGLLGPSSDIVNLVAAEQPPPWNICLQSHGRTLGVVDTGITPIPQLSGQHHGLGQMWCVISRL